MTATSASPVPAITTPFWDGAMAGGISLVGMSAALVYFWGLGESAGGFVKSDWIVLAILINSTHFMASYRLLYASADVARRSPWAAFHVPLILSILFVYRLVGPGREMLADGILVAASLYLAVHYTGQAWGMVASFAHLGGLRFEVGERRAIRFGMWTLLVLHMLLAIGGRFPPEAWITRADYQTLYQFAFRATCVVAGVTLLLGAAAYLRARRRGQPIPVRTVVPWLSLYVWYPTWFLVPGGPLWVQLSHALQYLAFPLRVEANRFSARSEGSVARHLLLVYLCLVVAGVVFLKGPPLTTRIFGPGWYSTPMVRDAFGTFVLLINIHHFFIDGALWKLRNPEVRRELFAHVDPPRASD